MQQQTQHRRRYERNDQIQYQLTNLEIPIHIRGDIEQTLPIDPHHRQNGPKLDENLEGLGPRPGKPQKIPYNN